MRKENQKPEEKPKRSKKQNLVKAIFLDASGAYLKSEIYGNLAAALRDLYGYKKGSYSYQKIATSIKKSGETIESYNEAFEVKKEGEVKTVSACVVKLSKGVLKRSNFKKKAS